VAARKRYPPMPFELELKKRHLALLVGSLAALAALATVPQLLGGVVAGGVEGLGDASPGWLWLAALGFAGTLVASGGAWEWALTRCGADTTRGDSTARFCTGSLVNALAPARVGTAVRLALFSRVLDGEGRLWTVGGIAGSLSAVRALWLALVLALGSASGVLPRWPIAALLLAVGVAALVAWRARSLEASGRFAHVFDVFREIGRCPRSAARIAGWVGLAMGCRVAAATAVIAAFGVERPLAAALLVVPALDLAGILPLTPGNVGVASAAVAFALGAHGAPTDVAVAAGIAFGAVETLTTLAAGSASLLWFAARRADRARWQTAVAAAGCVALASAFGATVLVPLV
jgi:uncharacterized membrane protein YbhN (UPF0104 family)